MKSRQEDGARPGGSGDDRAAWAWNSHHAGEHVIAPALDPAEEGTTYIYAHARQGMFLPLLTASQRNDGAELIGRLVQVYTDDNKVYLYEIFAVKRHVRDFAIANNVPEGEHRLVMQTSEGPSAEYPKLQVAARLLNSQPADEDDAHPEPQPRICG